VTESTVQDRLPPDARGKVVSVDLRKAGLTEFGAMKSRGFSRPAEAAHCEFFFHGRPMTLARWPNEGAFEKIAGFPEAAGQGDEHGGTLGKLQEGFRYDGDRPRRWKSTEDIWVHGYWAWDWANSYERIASIDLEQRLVRTAPPHGVYGFRKGQRFHFLNILEELDQPGEYYLDRKSGFLYFWPPTALEASEALLSLLDQPVIRVQKAAHLEIRSLRIEASRTTGIEISSSVQCRVESCDLRNLGNSGVIISGGSSNSVAACNVSDTGDGGVSLSGGDRKSLTASGHSVENTLFERQGRWSKCYVPAIGIEGVGQRASHNVIRNHPHCAILFGGNDHLMEFNEIHHIALETGDVGAIYTGRDYTYRGNRIRHNFIHHTGGVGMGSMGVYMDDCVSGTEVYGNVFYKVHWAMFIGGGRDMRVDNNIFVDCDPAVRADGRGLDRSPVWRNMVDRTMRDRLNDAPLDLYRQRYPAMRSLDAHYGPPQGPAIQGEAFHGVPPEGNVIRRNLCVGKWIDIGWQAKPEMFDVRDNQVGGDPGFVSVEKMDFRLKPGAGPLPPGFDPVPFERMGLENTPARRAVEALLTPQ
jgi:hypothetical protein